MEKLLVISGIGQIKKEKEGPRQYYKIDLSPSDAQGNPLPLQRGSYRLIWQDLDSDGNAYWKPQNNPATLKNAMANKVTIPGYVKQWEVEDYDIIRDGGEVFTATRFTGAVIGNETEEQAAKVYSKTIKNGNSYTVQAPNTTKVQLTSPEQQEESKVEAELEKEF